MKTIKITLLILISFITIQAQEQKRDYPRPLNEVEYDDNEKINIESTQSLHKINDTINITWQKLNGPYGAVITALYANGDTLLVSTGMDKGIIFYSVDKGKTWHKSNFKSNEGIIDFIKTDFGIYLASCGTRGLYKSADLVSWEKVILNNLPTNLDVMFLGKDYKGGIYFTARDINNIYYSKDTLKTWKIDSQLSSGGFMGFLLHGNGDLYLGGYNVYEKRRDSVTWYKSSLQYERNLGIHLVQDEKGSIFAGSANRREFLESKDSGKTWIDKDTANFLHQLYYHDLTYSNNNLIAAGWPDPFLTGWGVAISKDKGSTWEYSNEGLLPFSYAGRLATSGEDTYLGMWGGGIYRSTNQGEDWHPWMTGLAGASCNQMTMDNNGNLLISSWGEGVQKSKDDGLTWETLENNDWDGAVYGIAVDSSNNIYAGGNSGLFISSNNGLTWEKKYGGTILRMLEYDKNTILALDRYEGVIKSTDGGLTWVGLGGNTANAYSLVKDNKGNIYLGENGGSIWKSSNLGTTWVRIKKLTSAYHVVYGIAISKNGTIWAASDVEGLIKSTDDGSTWEVVLPGRAWRVFINDKDEIFFAKQNRSIYPWDIEVFSDGGLFYSKDEGKTWSNISGNMSYIQVDDMLFKENSEMYLSTDESMFIGSLPLSVEDNNNEQIVTEYLLSQNYPNPFNPSTTINYALPEPGYVTLKIYNTLGEEVKTLVNEYKQTGNHQVSFNAKDLSSGLYIYQINVNGNSNSKKMVLMK